MCNTSLQLTNFNNTPVDPLSFSTFHLLRTCNRLMIPNTDDQNYYNMPKAVSLSPNVLRSADNTANSNYHTALSPSVTSKSPILDVIEAVMPISETNDDSQLDVETHDESNRKSLTRTFHSATENEGPALPTATSMYRSNGASLPLAPTLGVLPPISSRAPPTLLAGKAPLPAFEYIAPTNHTFNISDFPLMELNRVGVFPAFLHRRSRGEKRPIPDEQKDEKYYERRKRNNEAAKKSRDARKIREDRIAFRAALLEQENSILRAQVMALRDELQTMRQLISTATTASTVSSLVPPRNVAGVL